MKKTILFLSFFSLSLMVLTSCGGDDETSPKKLQIVIDGETISLEGSTFYMGGEEAAGNGTHKYRYYYIENQSITLYFEIAVLNDADFGPGSYPNRSSWSGVVDATISYIEFSNSVYQLSSLTSGDFDPIVVKGGTDIGEEMTISFNGMLNDGADGVEVSFYYSEEVGDIPL